jgi:16S rRNA (cytidine1402-2'-O)-methyltransferase
MMEQNGVLYLVATPIGNLKDITLRALEILRSVDGIAAEDTRHSRRLLAHYGIERPLISLHGYNERQVSERLLERLRVGAQIALISDAGTPLISDPGFPLVAKARALGIRVVPIPGPCALIAALSASGLATARFLFEGFVPRTAALRRSRFESWLREPRTVVFYESSHRIEDCLRDIAATFPAERKVVLAREITKIHEEFFVTTARDAPRLFATSPDSRKGEFVVMIEGARVEPAAETLSAEALRMLQVLLEEGMAVKRAAAVTAKITGVRKDVLYGAALQLREADRVGAGKHTEA